MYRLSTERQASIIRFENCGLTRTACLSTNGEQIKNELAFSSIFFFVFDRQRRERENTYAMPRIRFIRPGWTKFNVLSCFTTGQRNCASPPPRGGAPRFFIWWTNEGQVRNRNEAEILFPFRREGWRTRNSKPSLIPNGCKCGKVTVRIRSTYCYEVSE